MTTEGNIIEILLIEDNPGDVELTRDVFAEWKLRNNIYVVENGEEGLDFLYRRGKFGNAVRPDIIFLDLNMPRINGRKMLQEIKRDKNLCDIPVVILTSSEAERIDINSKFYATSYIIKPLDLEKFLGIISGIETFGLNVVKLDKSYVLPMDKK
jgi:CheY-like chemotaxis protein